jgi:hypothetical protein
MAQGAKIEHRHNDVPDKPDVSGCEEPAGARPQLGQPDVFYLRAEGQEVIINGNDYSMK